MNEDRNQTNDEFYIPTPKEVTMKRGRKRQGRAAKSTATTKPKRQKGRLKGRFSLRVSKKAAERRKEATAPRSSATTKQGPSPSVEPKPAEEKPEPRMEPTTPSSDTPSTKTPSRGEKVRKVRPLPPDAVVRPAPPPPEPEPTHGKERATHRAKKLGHKLKPWETTQKILSQGENYFTTCQKCGRMARATLEPLEGHPRERWTWRYTEGALEVNCDGL